MNRTKLNWKERIAYTLVGPFFVMETNLGWKWVHQGHVSYPYPTFELAVRGAEEHHWEITHEYPEELGTYNTQIYDVISKEALRELIEAADLEYQRRFSKRPNSEDTRRLGELLTSCHFASGETEGAAPGATATYNMTTHFALKRTAGEILLEYLIGEGSMDFDDYSVVRADLEEGMGVKSHENP